MLISDMALIFVSIRLGIAPPKVKILSGCVLGANNDIGCSCEVIFEEYVLTAPNVHITDRDHCFDDVSVPIMQQSTRSKGPVIIGNGSWIGYGVQIMSGITIGRNCIVAAGAVVTKDIPDFCVAGGNPARVLKQYNFDLQQWERVK